MNAADTIPAKPSLGSRAAVVVAALALIAAIGWIDFRSGYEISVFPLYAFPIAWIAWQVGPVWGAGFSVLAAGEWLWADLADGHVYAHAWIPWERTAMNLAVFSFIAFSFHHFRRNLARKNRQVRQLEGILPICMVCKRISDSGGEWTDLDGYLRRHSEAKTEPCLCPDCAGARFR